MQLAVKRRELGGARVGREVAAEQRRWMLGWMDGWMDKGRQADGRLRAGFLQEAMYCFGYVRSLPKK